MSTEPRQELLAEQMAGSSSVLLRGAQLPQVLQLR